MNSLERREAMGPKAKQDPESVVKEIKRNVPAVNSIQKRKSGSYWKVCEVKTVLRISVGKKG
jgi:hypothetical protein